METEPTAEKRQRQAFEFLRNHARNAHIAGDGLLVGLLCQTGLDQVSKLAKEKKLLLPFPEIAWMPIFALHWLVNPGERHSIEQTLKELQHSSEEDRLVAQWVERYRFLIEQPLVGDAKLSPALKDFLWPDSFAEHSPEAEALVGHLVELAWFHGPTSDGWKQLAETWLRNAPVWTHASLTALKTRLELQARLTTPDKVDALLPESEAQRLHAHDEIAEIWLLHLQGRAAAVCEAAERLSPSLSAESHRWRVLHDFIHFNGRYGPSEDSQGVWLARRRRLSVETPLLIFNDKREERLTETLGELFRAHSEGEASKRWDIYLLARLHELAALRLWDYGMWLEAIRAQAQASLEVVQWTDAHPGMSAEGLVNAIRSFCSKSPKKDTVVRRAIDTLEFAPTEVLAWFSNCLLATYPRQKHQVLELLEDVTDLLPPETWPDLAHWTISYVKESSEDRAMGWTLAAAKHWFFVLPVLPVESPVWTTLQSEAMGMAKASHCWRSDYGAFLQRWLSFAPLPLAREVAEAMAVHPETASGECFARAEILIEFEEWNPGLRGTYTQRLFPKPHSASEALILAKHLEEGDLTKREETLRERVAKNVREAIAQATPEPDVKQFNFAPVSGVHLVGHWQIQDQPLLEDLIAAVNSPNVLNEYLSWLLGTIQLLVSNGPSEFAEIVQPHVTKWTLHLPHGRNMMDAQSGPLSVMQWSNGGEGEIALMLGWLAFQLPRKLGSAAHSDVLAWVRQILLVGESRPLDLAIYGSAVIALQMPPLTSAEPLALMETAMISLWSRATHDSDATQILANAVNNVATLIDSDLHMPPEQPTAGDEFVAVLSRFVPRFSKTPRASLRAAVATLVWRLKERGRQEAWVSDTLTALQVDRRARVRFEAHGGWKVARNRAVGASDS